MGSDPKPRTAWNHRRKRERGQSLVEFALVLPIFLILVFGIVDFGLGIRSWISITNAAREGARVGAVRGDCTAIRDRVKSASDLVTSDSQITITPATCTWAAGSSVKVKVTYDYKLITPLAGFMSWFGGGVPDSLTISSSSDMRIE